MTVISEETIIQRVIDLIVEILNIPPENVDGSKQLLDLGVDSMGIVIIISSIEHLYDTEINIEDLLSDPTVKGLAVAIHTKVNNKS